MLPQLNYKIFKEYSHTFAVNICDCFFKEFEAITGPQILELTPILQINLLVIKELYQKWHTFTNEINSPYFDFENNAVIHLKEQFSNLLSQHLSVRRTELEPLVAQATSDTLLLICEPVTYFETLFQNQPNGVVEQPFLEDLKKYLRINAFVPALLQPKMPSQCSAEQALNLIEDILAEYDSRTESFENWKDVFSSIEPTSNYPFYNYESDTMIEKAETEQAIDDSNYQSFFDTIGLVKNNVNYKNDHKYSSQSTLDPEKNSVIPTVEIEEIKVEDTSYHFQLPLVTPEVPVIETSTGEEIEAKIENIPLRERPLPIPKPPITNFAENIPLHQKFLFIFSLFAGKTADYNLFIEKLESAKNVVEANQIVELWHIKNDWSRYPDVLVDLEELMARRFNN
jgi:hypothetical protein